MKQIIYLLMATCIIVLASNLISQELTTFEILDYETIGLTTALSPKHGQAIKDIDGNGYPDIFHIRWMNPGNSKIYLNYNGNYNEITNLSPHIKQIEGRESNTRGALLVDYDNDGDSDLSLSTDKNIYLLRNDNNVFTNVSEEMGFVSQIPPGFINSWALALCGWADYDLDGDLDCAVSQHNNTGLYLFRNDVTHFTNIASEVGLDTVMFSGSIFISWSDFDLDGDPDLFSNQYFYRNDDGYFNHVTDEIGLSQLPYFWFRNFIDYDNDGDLDYVGIVGSSTAEGTNGLYENRDGIFVNVSEDVGWTLARNRYRALTTGDCDNDGDLDLFVQLNIDESYDLLYVNDEFEDGSRAFADVAQFVGITEVGDRKGGAFFDYDMDGFLDIYIPSVDHHHILYHNMANNGTTWIGFKLEGTVSNRDAVGSVVTLYTGEKKQMRYTVCGTCLTLQDNPFVHFGLGFNATVDSVTIRWPLGHKQVLTDMAINQYHDVKEPDYTSFVKNINDDKIPSYFRLEKNYPNPFNPNTTIEFYLTKESDLGIVIYDLLGQIVRTFEGRKYSAGSHAIQWNGRDNFGKEVVSGIYFYQCTINDLSKIKKMLLIR